MDHLTTQAPLDPKQAARLRVGRAVKSGRLVRRACETCGAPKTEAHHEDYSKPLEVVWLCRRCHSRLHGARGDKRAGGLATAKSHCKYGHPMVGGNIRYRNGKRHSCIKCRKIQENERRRKRRAGR